MAISWSLVLMLMACASSLVASPDPGVSDVEAFGVERLGRRLKTSWRLPKMTWLTGNFPSLTFWRYCCISRSLRCSP